MEELIIRIILSPAYNTVLFTEIIWDFRWCYEGSCFKWTLINFFIINILLAGITYFLLKHKFVVMNKFTLYYLLNIIFALLLTLTHFFTKDIHFGGVTIIEESAVANELDI